MSQTSLARPILLGTLVAGTLDIVAAIVVTLSIGRRSVDQMLGGVAAGPFPGAPDNGVAAVLLGLAVHFALMAIMVAIYVAAAARLAALRRQPLLWGALYGVATYVVMNLLVVPIRFTGAPALPASWLGFGTQFGFHILLVGIPIALIAARCLGGRTRYERGVSR